MQVTIAYKAHLLGLLILIQAQFAGARELPDFTPLVESNATAVVNISTNVKNSRRMVRPHFDIPDVPENSPLYEFFNKFFGEIPQDNGPFERRSPLGSGFIVSEDGYIITNHHVVKDADEIIVRMNDRREFVAELTGSDARSDIALLKVEADDLPALKLGSAQELKVGQWVLAIGSPFGFDHSVTAGIISAIGRSLPNENYVPFIQTDVAINPGNSGGPLFDLNGEVIGVNSQIYSRTGGFMGLSFAVPVDLVKNVYQQLRQQGRVSRGWLGVLIQDVTRELAESFDMSRPHGALISKVLPDSPAADAGLEVGDIVTRFDGKEIRFSSDLPPLVGSSAIDKWVPIDILRRGKNKTIRIKIAELSSDDVEVSISSRTDKGSSKLLGLKVKELTEEQRSDLEIDDHGVIVTEVMPGPAQQAGLNKGDIILLLNNTRIEDVAHFAGIIEGLPKNRPVPMLIQRQGGPIFLALQLTEPE